MGTLRRTSYTPRVTELSITPRLNPRQRCLPKGAQLISQGQEVTAVYLIIDGVVALSTQSLGQKIHVMFVGPGTYIGDISSFVGDNVANIEVAACEDIKFIEIDQRELHQDFNRLEDKLLPLMSIAASTFHSVVSDYLPYVKLDSSETLKSQSDDNFLMVLRDSPMAILLSFLAELIDAEPQLEQMNQVLGSPQDLEEEVVAVFQAVTKDEDGHILDITRLFLERWLLSLSRSKKSDSIMALCDTFVSTSMGNVDPDDSPSTVMRKRMSFSSVSISSAIQSRLTVPVSPRQEYLSARRSSSSVANLGDRPIVANSRPMTPRSRRTGSMVANAKESPVSSPRDSPRGVFGDKLALGRDTKTKRTSMTIAEERGQENKISDLLKRMLKGEIEELELPPGDLTSEITDWNFDVHSIKTVDELQKICLEVVSALGLIEMFDLEPQRVVTYISLVASMYSEEVLYHNFHHAVDVCVACYWMIQQGNLASSLKPTDILAVILGCIGHDCGHFGRTNDFEVRTKSALAVRYNDQSVLENLHSDLSLMAIEESGLLEHLKEKEEIKTMLKTAVLATDMAKHMEFIQDAEVLGDVFNRPVEWKSQSERDLLVSLVIKLADLSNPTRHPKVGLESGALIMEELFRQGDYEHELGLEVPRTRDRSQTPFLKSQIDFISIVVRPLVPILVRSFPALAILYLNLKNNVSLYQQLREAKNQNEDADNPIHRENSISSAAKEMYLRVTVDDSSGGLNSPY